MSLCQVIRQLQPRLQPPDHPGQARVCHSAFPYYDGTPPALPKSPHVSSIPVNIAQQLSPPEGPAGFRPYRVCAIVAVPKAPVNKDGCTVLRQYDVRRPREVTPMQSKPISRCMEEPSDRDFR